MKKSKLFLFFALAAMTVMASSCVTSKKVRYLQDMPVEGMPLNESLEATISPFDEMRIYVLSNAGKEDELLKPFNALSGNLNQAWPVKAQKLLDGTSGKTFQKKPTWIDCLLFLFLVPT